VQPLGLTPLTWMSVSIKSLRRRFKSAAGGGVGAGGAYTTTVGGQRRPMHVLEKVGESVASDIVREVALGFEDQFGEDAGEVSSALQDVVKAAYTAIPGSQTVDAHAKDASAAFDTAVKNFVATVQHPGMAHEMLKSLARVGKERLKELQRNDKSGKSVEEHLADNNRKSEPYVIAAGLAMLDKSSDHYRGTTIEDYTEMFVQTFKDKDNDEAILLLAQLDAAGTFDDEEIRKLGMALRDYQETSSELDTLDAETDASMDRTSDLESQIGRLEREIADQGTILGLEPTKNLLDSMLSTGKAADAPELETDPAEPLDARDMNKVYKSLSNKELKKQWKMLPREIKQQIRSEQDLINYLDNERDLSAGETGDQRRVDPRVFYLQ
jgi:hypothetical protein